MSNALEQDLGWFWYYWLWTTESVDGAIDSVSGAGSETVVTIRQDGQMPSPVVLLVKFAEDGPAIEEMANAEHKGELTRLVTWPVDVWFGGSRRFAASLKFGARKIEKIILDPAGRFPDATPKDSVWLAK